MASLKLSKTIREGIVAAIMADVPKVDYRGHAEKLMRDCIESQLPDEIKALLKTQYGDRLEVRYFFQDFYKNSVRIGVRGASGSAEKLSDDVREKIKELYELECEQAVSRDALKRKVEATLLAFNTVDQVRTSCPEFDKYLPSAVQPVKNLPAITSTVADLMHAGWPKGKGE